MDARNVSGRSSRVVLEVLPPLVGGLTQTSVAVRPGDVLVTERPYVSGLEGDATWSYSGILPAGLTFDPLSGVFSGVAASTGASVIRLSVTDSADGTMAS